LQALDGVQAGFGVWEVGIYFHLGEDHVYVCRAAGFDGFLEEGGAQEDLGVGF